MQGRKQSRLSPVVKLGSLILSRSRPDFVLQSLDIFLSKAPCGLLTADLTKSYECRPAPHHAKNAPLIVMELTLSPGSAVSETPVLTALNIVSIIIKRFSFFSIIVPPFKFCLPYDKLTYNK